ncbi:MAG TPA: DUF5947 family protein [Pseudonocardia sp.]|nr:DUF5947 family protein [Pseudonocardia sp.]
MTSVSPLRRFLRDPAPRERAQEVCELCATPVPAQHPHLVQVAERRMLCACGPCGFLFDNPGAGGGGYRRVPDRYLVDAAAAPVTDAQWDELAIPVGIAFFLHNSAQDRIIACYPSPAGATESELELPSWRSGIGAGRLAAELRPDVEALLVRREHPCLLVPIDACYRLVGLVKLHWRGFDGGSEAWAAIDAFFGDLQAEARPLG